MVEKRVSLGSSKPAGDDRETVHVDLDDMTKEQVLEMLLVFLAQNMSKAGMSDEFILVVRDEERGRWGSMTTIRDVKKMAEVLRRMGSNTPDVVEEKTLSPEDFVKRSN